MRHDRQRKANLGSALLALSACAISALAQSPDIIIRFPQSGAWDAPMSTVSFDNRNQGIFYWAINYQAQNCTALSLRFESATGVSTPGAFGAYSGTLDSGINPNTNTSGATSAFEGFVSWYRVSLTSLAGAGCNVNGVLYGYRTANAAVAGVAHGGGGCVGTIATPCVVVGPAATGTALAGAPVRIGVSDGTNARDLQSGSALGDGGSALDTAAVTGTLFNGASFDRMRSGGATGSTMVAGAAANGAALAGNPILHGVSDGVNVQNVLTCRNTVLVNDSTSGNTQQIALSGGTKVYICKVTLSTAAAVNVKLTQGTGANCAGGTSDLSGLYQLSGAGSIADDFAADMTYLVSAGGNAVCLNLSGNVSTTGAISYAQF